MRVHLYVHQQQLKIISSLLLCIVFSGLLNVKIAGANAIGETNAVAAAADAPNRRPFLDVYLRVEPVDDFCGALRCNISYAILLTNMQNKFDLHSLMLQDGHMPRRSQENGQPPVGGFFFEDNTVVRLSDELRTKRGKIYLGLMLFDLPDDIQDYLVVEVTNVIRTGRRVKTEFSSDTVRIGVQVYRRNEAASSALDQSSSISDLQTQQRSSSSSSSSSLASITRARALVSNGKNVEKRHHNQQEEEEEEEQGQLKRPLIEQGQGQKSELSSSADAAEADSFSAVVIGTDDSGKMPMTEKQETAPKCATNVAARSCACCEHVTVRKIRLDDEVCVNVTYLPTKIGVRLAVSVDGHVYYSKDLAVFNPESACFEVPEMREYASICINLYNMELKNNKLTGCAKLEAILLHLRVAQHKIGCFSIPI